MKNVSLIQHKLLLFIFGLLFLSLHLLAKPNQSIPTIPEEKAIATLIDPDDQAALTIFYNATDGPNWDNKTKLWLNPNSNDWYGVTVDPTTGRVTEINLEYNNLDGELPAELGDLSELRVLNLKRNRDLRGIIPFSIGSLGNLEKFYLSENQMDGGLPNSIGGLTKLKILEIYNTYIGEEIPLSIRSLSELKVLRLYNNRFDGDLPPQITYLTMLDTLNLRNNNFEGRIPDNIGNLSNLIYLNLRANNFDDIPSGIIDLDQLIYLDLSDNLLEFEIPTFFRNLQNLEELHLGNNFLSGEIPAQLRELSNLKVLALNSNELEGQIPPELAQLTELNNIILFGNRLEGEIPLELFEDLPHLIQFYVYKNRYTFETLEDKKGLYNSIDFVYNNQAKVGQTQDVQLAYGDNYTLDVECGGIKNQYQWYFNTTIPITPFPISSSSIELSNLDYSKSGIYTCEITNDDATQLILYSNPITISVQASAPADKTIDGCDEDAIANHSLFDFRQLQQAVSVADFRAEGGVIESDCDEADISISYIDASDGGFNPLIVTRTYTISDCHEAYAITQIFTITDETKPVAICRDTILVLDSNYFASVTPQEIGVDSYDLCDANLTYTSSDTLFSDDDIGSNNVILTVTDASGNSNTCEASVRIIAYNHEPTNITLSNNTIPENEAIGTEVGILEAVDLDFGDSFTYSFVEGVGAGDNSLFTIEGNRLLSDIIFNFEIDRLYNVRIEAKDYGGKTFSRSLPIDIIDVNEPPTNINLSAESIKENEYAGALVGDLETIDEDINDIHSYTLVDGASANDNVYFSIQGDQLITNEIFDFETKEVYFVLIKSTDIGGLDTIMPFVITIIDVNDPPTELELSNQVIKENQDIGTEIGVLSTTDIDINESFTYSFVSGEGDDNNNSFSIVDDLLVSNEVFDFETKESYIVRIQSEDNGGDTISKSFEIDILNLNPEDLGVDIPDAFSPNEDGINDYYQILYIEQFPEANINIFNRWGSLVYEKEQYGNVEVYGEAEAWWDGRLRANGKTNSTVLPTGTYFVVLRLDDKKIFKGTVYLKK